MPSRGADPGLWLMLGVLGLVKIGKVLSTQNHPLRWHCQELSQGWGHVHPCCIF